MRARARSRASTRSSIESACAPRSPKPGIEYEWRGEALGGRPDDPKFLTEGGALDLDALWRWAPLVADLDRVASRAPGERQALLCAEENPKQCHRRVLLTPPLVKQGLEVLHIRGDGRLELEKDPALLL